MRVSEKFRQCHAMYTDDDTDDDNRPHAYHEFIHIIVQCCAKLYIYLHLYIYIDRYIYIERDIDIYRYRYIQWSLYILPLSPAATPLMWPQFLEQALHK